MQNCKRILAALLMITLLCTLIVPGTVFAADVVNVAFNALDSTERQDMEPATNTAIKDMAVSTERLEGTGSVKFGYKGDQNGLYWYGRTPAAYANTGLDIAGAQFMTFDLYVSDTSKWTLTNNCLIGLRSLASAQGTGQWDTSCGQVKSADLYAAFSSLKNGWNRVVLPIDTSVATQTVIWGYRIQFPASSAKAGFYMLMDDVRFVNQAYLDSAEAKNTDAYKAVAMQIAALPATPEITVAHETAVMSARAAYNALSTDLQLKVSNYSTLVAAEHAIANLGEYLDLQIDGLNNNSLVILPAGNTGTNYPKGSIIPDRYTEGDGSLFSNWPKPASGTLTGSQNGINISLVGIGGDSGLNFSSATYVSFDLFLHGVTFTEGKDASVRFGTQASWSSSDAGTFYFTDQAKTMKEGWNHFTVPINVKNTAVKNMWIAFDNSCTAVTLTAEDAYVLLDDVRLLNAEGKAVNNTRNQAKPVISAIAFAYKTGGVADIKAARSAYDALSDGAKEYVYNLDKLAAAEASVNIQFRSLDTLVGVNGGNGTQNRTAETTNYLEGTGAIKWAYTSDAAGLFWYVYCNDSTNDTVGPDITGAEYMTFDLYVSDVSKWTLAGDTRVNLRDSSDGWNSKAGQVPAADMNSTFKALKTGWNHVVLPLDRSTATTNNVWAFRMYFASGTAPNGFYTIIDDIRFVSGAYLKSQQYANTIAAKDVAAQIGTLNASSTSTQVYAVQSAYLALTDEQKPLVANVAHLNNMVTNISSNPVSFAFRNLDNAERTAQEAATTTITVNKRVEGTGAAMFEHAVDRNDGLYWYVYCEAAAASTGCNIAGATHITFDFFVSDPSLWNIGTADMRLSVRNVKSTGWDNSCTQVSAANMRTAFSNVKQGWNHIVMPLESLLTNDAFAFRMYMAGGSVKQGFYTIIDDIRFVNSAYLASAEYSNKIAAKDVAGLISQLTKNSSHAQLTEARTAYNALTQTQKGYVCNYDWLTTYEAGGTLASDAPKTFQTIPSSHLGNLANFAKGDFSLAILSDLHYAVNWNSQQKDIYLNSMQYILDRAGTENTLMTLQLGDMTSGNKLAEWRTVREGFQMLVDGGMPYATTIGNHDIGGGANAAYNAFLPYSEQVSGNPYLAGAKEVGKTDNLYYTFTVSGVKYMVLVLACYPKDDVLNWANQVVQAHADHNVILVTHSYLQVHNGTLGYTEETEALAAGYKGIDVWNKFVKVNPNVFMTFSAHNSYPTPGQNGVGLLTSKNDAGRNVYQFLVPDPQGYENTYGGLGSLFMLRFSNQGKTVTGEYIATRYNKDFIGYGNNNFTISYDPIMPQVDYAGMAKEVDNQITALPASITLANESAVIAARSAYNALPDQAKSLVTKLSVLTAAETKIAELKAQAEQEAADKAAAQAVMNQIAALNVQSLDDESSVVAARNAYKALTDAQKGYVTNLDTLNAAEAKIAELKAQAEQDYVEQNAIKAVEDKIAAIGTVTLDKESAITAAREAYEALTDTQKAYVTKLGVLVTAEQTLATLKAQAEQEAAAKAVDDRIAALPDSNLDASYQGEIDAINEAIAALPEEVFDLLENLAVFSLKANAVHLATVLANYPADPDEADLTDDQWEQLQSDLEKSSLKGDAVALLTEELQAKYTAYATFDPNAIAYGDVDGDGKVSAADALEVLKAVVGNVTLTDEQKVLADVDGDEKTSSDDALHILKKVVGKIDRFPAEE